MKLCIDAVRKRQGLSQEELAKHLKVSQETVSRYETGIHKIRFSTLCSIARKLGVPVTALFIADDAPEVEQEPHEVTHV